MIRDSDLSKRDNTLLKKQQDFHQSIRKNNKAQSINQKRLKFQQQYTPIISSPLQLIQTIEQQLKQNRQFTETLENLILQLQHHQFTNQNKDETKDILLKCSSLFINIFKRNKVKQSQLALFGISNLLVDYDLCDLIELKYNLIEYFLEVVSEEKQKRGQFTGAELQEIQFIQSNFLNSNAGLLNQEQTITILYNLSQKTNNEQLILSVSRTIQKFIRDKDNIIVYHHQLFHFIDWTFQNLKKDLNSKTTEHLLRIINILISKYSSQIQYRILQQIFHTIFRHITSSESYVKCPVYLTMITILKAIPVFSSIVIQHFNHKLLMHLRFQQSKIKLYILGVYDQMIKGQTGKSISASLQKTILYKILIDFIKQSNDCYCKFDAVKIIYMTIQLTDEKEQQIKFMKQLIQLGILEALESVKDNSYSDLSKLSNQLLDYLDEFI